MSAPNVILESGSGVQMPPRTPSTAALLFGVFGGPVAWNAQLVANYALATYPCFRGGITRSEPLPGWEAEWPLLLAINLAAILITSASVAVGLQAWRSARRSRAAGGDTQRGATLRAMGIAGLMSGGVFLIAIVFALVALLMAPQCSG